MIRQLLLAATVAVAIPTAAGAQTTDAFTSFDGTQGAGGFFYGEVPAAGAPGAFYVPSTGTCFIAGATCLTRAADGSLPGFTKSTATSFQYGTVNVPNDQLLAHPGNDALLTSSIFVSPTGGQYRFSATFTALDTNPTGVGINFLRAAPGGGSPYSVTSIGSLGSTGQTFTYTGNVNLTAFDSFGFGIDNAGNYSNDSTGFNFSVTAVPEPATWGMMILGFGVLGALMRRRRQGKLAIA